jgi:hypothetical protein
MPGLHALSFMLLKWCDGKWSFQFDWWISVDMMKNTDLKDKQLMI